MTAATMEKQKKFKTRVEIFFKKWWNIPGGNFLIGNFPGTNSPDGSLIGGNSPGESFPGSIHLI